MTGQEGMAAISGLSRTGKKAWYIGWHAPDRRSGVVDGSLPPSTWSMPVVSGGMASRNFIFGDGSTTFAGNLGLNGQSDLTGSGDIIPPFGQLVVSAVASLTGSGAITNADAKAFLNAFASLTGSGALSAATLSALGFAVAGLTGSGTGIGTASALGALSAALTVSGSTLTTSNVGAAVWQYLIEAGYTGEQIMRLLAAHASGDGTGLEGASPAFK